MFCNEIGWHDLQLRQVSSKLADYAAQFANWLANLTIGRLAWPICKLARLADWTEHYHSYNVLKKDPAKYTTNLFNPG